ncbi:glycoside hydrolase family 65 protein [Clostridium folliculivorans]|uniref:Maltose phosphorylase n=1 Tax=Clostridium folliculivorans TaxID=2886038 RepID=A0A9W6D997_9CLOT|nr:glycosyl hydrolase family 65 protein [Clostridium folliculivorans]GKU23671.1 maltose phosphorylase [Clostridium folliculivorans]GKU29787.1 maltose phosphorylase [Clostridium folliculivorans]
MKFNKFDKLWCIKEDQFNVNNNKYYEGIFTQGNGFMSIRGSFEEGINDAPQDEEYIRMPANVTLETARNPRSKWGTYVPGIVGIHPLLKEEIINLPCFLEVILCFEDEKLDTERCEIEEYTRWLDLRDATLNRIFIWNTKCGAKLELKYSRFISLNDKNICAQQIKIKLLKGNGKLKINSGINGNVRTNGYNHLNNIEMSFTDEKDVLVKTTTDKGDSITQISSTQSMNGEAWDEKLGTNVAFLESNVPMNENEEITINKYNILITDRDTEKDLMLTKGMELLKRAKESGFDKLYEVHKLKWDEKWENSDIKIGGNDNLQIAIRMSIYHLIRSNAEKDSRVAICAKGYAGEAYFGRYFWDTEIYMLPYYIYTNPEAARNLILFRYNTLEGAKKNAKHYGYNGARYPWESSVTGEEQCPLWQYADHEIHVTADIAYAIWHYYMATNDEEFMQNYGIDILVETSRYWIDRVDKNEKGYYELLGVMGPDEYLPLTRNNSYTNRMVKFNLSKTIEYIDKIKKSNVDFYISIAQRLNLRESEIENFSEVQAKLVLCYDKDTEIVPQSEDFYKYADLDFLTIWKDRSKPFGHFISQEKNYRSKALKQADVLELMVLFQKEFSREQIIKAYEYYEPITTHDSSLSAAIHSIICCWIGKEEDTEKFLNKAIDIDMSLEKKGAEEGIHIANCGGLWQLVVFGFAGLKSPMDSEELKFEPKLPKSINSMDFSIIWHNKSYNVSINKDGYEVKAK